MSHFKKCLLPGIPHIVLEAFFRNNMEDILKNPVWSDMLKITRHRMISEFCVSIFENNALLKDM